MPAGIQRVIQHIEPVVAILRARKLSGKLGKQIKQQAERKVRERADSDSSSRPNQGDKKS